MDVQAKKVEDVVNTSVTNGVSTATLPAAGAGLKWRVTGWGASFAAAAVATPVLATATVGGETVSAGVSTNGDGWHVQLAYALESEENGQPSCSLSDGGVGAQGRTYIMGYKIPANYNG